MPNLSFQASIQDNSRLKKTKLTKTNKKVNQPSQLKPLGLSYFCELSMYAKFQLPMLCLSCISMVEDGKERKKSAVLMATLATAQVELSLSWGWGWAKFDKKYQNIYLN